MNPKHSARNFRSGHARDRRAARVVPIRVPHLRDGRDEPRSGGPIALTRHRPRYGRLAALGGGGNLATFGRFALVGLSGTFVDLGGFFLLGLLVPMLAARGLAIWLAMTWNFFWNRRLTFAGARQDGVLRQYALFCGACGLGAIVNWGVSVGLCLGSALFAGHAMAAAVVGVAGATLVNYAACRYWVFRRGVPSAGCATVAFADGAAHEPAPLPATLCGDEVTSLIAPFPVGGRRAQAA